MNESINTGSGGMKGEREGEIEKDWQRGSDAEMQQQREREAE